jgi:predicted SnoaL-like aldol condensation-catalyzing enzyme
LATTNPVACLEEGNKEATTNRVKIRSADLYRIENGKIVGHWDVVHRLDLLKQTITFNNNDKSIKR